MSLTYAQKRTIQEQYPEKDVPTLALELGVSKRSIEKHLSKHNHHIKKEIEKKAVTVTSGKERWAYLALLAVMVLVVYFNGLFNDFVSDDIYVIVNGEEYFRSLSYFSINPTSLIRNIQYFLAYQIGGLTPFFFRLPGVLFHIGYVWMVYLIMQRFTKRKYLPFMVAAIAAVHPMMTESVVWISGGLYPQAAFFGLLSFYLYIRGKEESKKSYYLYSLLAFLASVSSLEKSIILPFIIALYEFSFGSLKKSWARVGGFFLLAFGWGLLLLGRVNDRLEYLQVTNGAESKFQFNNPFVQVPVALSKYFELYLWPDKLTLYQSEYAMNLQQYIFRAIITLIFFLIIGLAYKYKKSLFFWLSFFFISLLTTMNPFGLSWIVAERYSYLGSIGLYFAFVLLIYQLIDRPKLRMLGYTIFIVILIALSARTIVRNIDWKNEDNLWKATARVSPSDPKTHNNMGDVYARQGDLENAAKSFEEALRLNPNYPDATHNLANIYRMKGRKNEAFDLYMRAIELNPDIWQSHLNIGAIYFERQDYENALKHVLIADKIMPNSPQILANAGIIYITMGQVEEAKGYFTRTLQIDPENQMAKNGLESLKSK